MRAAAVAATAAALVLLVAPTSADGAPVPPEIVAGCAELTLPAPVCALVRQVDANIDGISRLGAPAPEVAVWQSTWAFRALGLQRALGDRLAFDDSEWLSTHNSYNSSAYLPPSLTGLDPNQRYTLADQFRMGIREVEIDIHDGLSDASPCHTVCTLERPLPERLAEIEAWLDAPGNEEEILVLDVADTSVAGAGFDVAAAEFLVAFGDRLYRPPADGACHAMPMEVTRNAIRSAGAQVVVVGVCDGHGPAWSSVTWQWDREQSSFPGTGEYPTCSPLGVASPGDGVLRRHWEDLTFVGSLLPDHQAITPADATVLDRCGVNLVSFDDLVPADGRLDAMVWSWAPGEPRASGGDGCAAAGPDGRFRTHSCDSGLPVACRDDGTGAWSITTATAAADEAEGVCRAEERGEAGVPASAVDAEQLRRTVTCGGDVWLDYRVIAGEWTPEAAGVSAPAPAPLVEIGS